VTRDIVIALAYVSPQRFEQDWLGNQPKKANL